MQVRQLTVSVPDRTLVEQLSFELRPGEFLAVLGRNGSGKSLTMATLAGLRDPDGGDILLDGEPAATMDRRRFAQRLALLPQVSDDVFPTSVLETAITGRHPHIPRWSLESPADVEITRDALRAMDIDDLRDRDVLTLSGGERRRLAIAQVLTQQPAFYLLDEPTNHLDPQHQLDTMQLLRRLAGNGAAILASLHDVNLAARFADRCLLLFGDGRWSLGATADTLDAGTLSELYGTDIRAFTQDGLTLFLSSALLADVG